MITDFKPVHYTSLPVTDDGSWINVVEPPLGEVSYLGRELGIPQEFVTHSLDIHELARIEKVGNTTLIILRVPIFQGVTAAIPYTTIPIGVVLTGTRIITISRCNYNVLEDLWHNNRQSITFQKRGQFVLQLLLYTSDQYLLYLQNINSEVELLEDTLQRSLQNKELNMLLKYQKSLVYFTTALKSNELMLDRLRKSQVIQAYPDNENLFEDVQTEIRQAIVMTSIASDILSQMMDAFASIISNNLNAVMKLLTAFTIILTFPTIVAGFYGMNVALPWQDSANAFLLMLTVSLVLSLAVGLIFRKQGWW
jgi:magnesium transporter